MTTKAAPSKTPAKPTVQRSLTRTLTGIVVSDKRDKTRTIAVAYQVKHPKYGKYLHRQTNYHVHDPENTSKNGDRVEIANCRPISKTKSWRLVRVVEQPRVTLQHQTEAPQT
jgi:small subunit ribosomal protein S17